MVPFVKMSSHAQYIPLTNFSSDITIEELECDADLGTSGTETEKLWGINDRTKLLNNNCDSSVLCKDKHSISKKPEELTTNAGGTEEIKSETSFAIAFQVVFPYLIAGLGMVGAGVVLDIVQHWKVFDVVDELFILVPSLLGLKGNLEMTLASRLSTQANLGNMDTKKTLMIMVMGNLALIQLQAIVVGLLASLTAMIFGWIPEGSWDMQHGALLCAAAILTASIASFVLGLIMVAVIVCSRKFNINPDNVATPIAASLGDLTTLALLSWIASILWTAVEKDKPWLAPVLISFFVLFIAPCCFYFSNRNSFVKNVLYNGWSPVIIAMAISSIGGLILDFAVKGYKGIAVFQPVMNGVGGNLVAVQASRISTSLHQSGASLGELPKGSLQGCANVIWFFFGSDSNARCHRVLLFLVIPGHLIFAYTISYLKAGHTSVTLIFAIVYLCAALIQVIILLYISMWLVHWLWKIGDDPDNCAIPYMTAMGDLLGTGLLAAAFQILWLVGDRDSDVGE